MLQSSRNSLYLGATLRMSQEGVGHPDPMSSKARRVCSHIQRCFRPRVWPKIASGKLIRKAWSGEVGAGGAQHQEGTALGSTVDKVCGQSLLSGQSS